jgi:hypothetical protein
MSLAKYTHPAIPQFTKKVDKKFKVIKKKALAD